MSTQMTFAEAIAKVEQPFRLLLEAKYLHDKSYDQIAAEYLLDVRDVTQDMHHARRLLLEVMKPAKTSDE